MKPDGFAAVMATGIVSVAALDHGYGLVSDLLVAVAVLMLPVLILASIHAWRREGWALRDIDTGIGLFTYVAACGVLAVRLADHRIVFFALAGMALQAWASLFPVVAASVWRGRWTALRDRAHGGWELASVATSGMAMVCVAAGTLFPGIILWVLALAVYLLMTALVLWRWGHDSTERRASAPDKWIVMGGLAIATLAGEHVHHALYPGPIADGVRMVTIGTWALATLWIPVLVALGLRRINAWPAVFPLGMYSSATYAMAHETDWRALTFVSLAFCWIALAAWVVTAIPALGRITGALTSDVG